MNKRDFLKTSGAFVASGLLSRIGAAQTATQHRTNWAGNYTFHTDHVLEPGTVEEVQKAVVSCNKLRAVGSRHSFNGIGDSPQTQISVQPLHGMTGEQGARAG